MRILILANNDIGLYRFRKELILKLIPNNEVFISLPYGPFVEKLTDFGCRFIKTDISRHGTNPFSDARLLRFYKKIIKSIRPNVVLTYTIKPNIYGGIACTSLRVPFIANITGLGNAVENKGLLQKIALALYKKSLKKSFHVFFQNSNNLAFFMKHNIKISNYSLLPGSGVNLKENMLETYPSDKDGLVFVTIGRILKDKGIKELLSSARIIKERHPNITFRIVGDMDGNYAKDVDDASRDGVIEYLGHRNDIHEIIKQSHATIHPSYHEGTSNVLLETAACGRPILASNVPGCNNTFDEETGIGFEPKSVESLVNAIETFVSLPLERKKEMGIRGRLKMEREFDRRIVIDAYVQIINKVEKENKINEAL